MLATSSYCSCVAKNWSTVLIKVKIKKQKEKINSTLNHSHAVVAPQRDSSTHHTPLHHSKVHPPHAVSRFTFIRTVDQIMQKDCKLQL